MTVAELIEELKKCPQDADVYAEGEPANKVCVEGYDEQGNPKVGFAQIVRIIKSWNCEFVTVGDKTHQQNEVNENAEMRKPKTMHFIY